MPRLNLILIALAITIIGCTSGHKFSSYSNIQPQGWSYSDPCTFSVNMFSDSTATGVLMVSITHDNSYQYSNMWLETSYTSAGTVHVDTANIKLCDLYGNWYGKGMPGHYQLRDTLVRHPVTLTDSTTITVRHIMRVDTLRGISQIGISLEQ